MSRGYARGERWIVRLDDGRTAFVKVGVEEWMVENMRAEMRVYAHVQGAFLPRVFAFDEDGDPPVLVLEDLGAAHWPPPWTTAHVEAVTAVVDEIAAVDPPPGLESLERLGSGWRLVAEDPAPFLTLGLATHLWLERVLPSLVDAEAATPLAGDSLVHCDLRSDNLCIRHGRAVLVDWNWASVGNPAFDVAFWLPSLVLEEGPPVEEIARRRPEVDAFAALVAGFFAHRAGQPPPDGAPAVRGFQRAQLEVALPWAARVLDLPHPDGRIAA